MALLNLEAEKASSIAVLSSVEHRVCSNDSIRMQLIFRTSFVWQIGVGFLVWL